MRLLAAIGCVILLLGADAAAAPQDVDWTACNNSQDHDASISGCTGVIDRGNREPIASRAHAYRNRADAYYRKGDAERAMRDAEEAIRLDPKLASAYNTRGHIYLGKSDYDRAVQDYDDAIRLNPKFANFYVNRGVAYARKGDADHAIRDADEAIRLEPNRPGGYHLRGNAHFLKHDYDRAIQDYDVAIQLDPVDASAYAGRGAAYTEKGELGRAMTELEAAIRLNPNATRAYFYRGLIFQHNGDRERAIADLHRALELEKNEAFAQEARAALAKITAETLGQTASSQAATSLVSPSPASPSQVAPSQVAQSLPPLAERRAALVIGNSDYKEVGTLPNPQRDAQAIAAVLRGIGFQTVTLANDLSREKFLDALRNFAAEAEKADWAVIYYAGHGIELGGVNYLIPVDARLVADRDVQFEAVPLDQVLGAVEGAHKLRLVLLDACRDNPFARRMQRSLAARSIGRGLARIEPGPGTLVAYAARDGQVALDGDGQNGPFAVALSKLLKQPGLEVNKLFRLVHDDVMEATGNRQEPYTYGALPGREDFFFVP